MEKFADIAYSYQSTIEGTDHKLDGLFQILNHKSTDTNVSTCLDRLKSKGWDLDCNEVYPNVFISDAEAAKNIEYLKAIGITHVLNTAEGDRFGMVCTNADFYKDSGIKYQGLPMKDLPSESLISYVHRAANFIDEGIQSGGKVLVHCVMGISRSSSCVIAYLMIKKHMRVHDAVQQVRNHREIRPNHGFLSQLLVLSKQLQSQSQS